MATSLQAERAIKTHHASGKVDVMADVEVTQLLRRWHAGDKAAGDELSTRIYGELHRLAASYARREPV
jgi:hypothetical protein